MTVICKYKSFGCLPTLVAAAFQPLRSAGGRLPSRTEVKFACLVCCKFPGESLHPGVFRAVWLCLLRLFSVGRSECGTAAEQSSRKPCGFERVSCDHLRDGAVPAHVVSFPALGFGVRPASAVSDQRVHLAHVAMRANQQEQANGFDVGVV